MEADAPNWASAKHFSGSISTLDFVPSEMRSYESRLRREEAELESFLARSKTHAAGAAAAAALFGGLPGGAGGYGDDGKGNGKKGGRGRV